VRHVRMLVLCLVAVFAMSAVTLDVASPALAGGCNQECKELKEKENQEAKEAKEHEKQVEKEKKAQEKAERKAVKEQEKREKEEIKTPGLEFAKFNQCALGSFAPNGLPISACIYGEAGPESYFQAGKVTVYFAKPVVLRGGEAENEETGQLQWIGALNGETISKEAEPAPSLTEGVDAELLPEAEKARYEEYLASGKSTKVTATIELAAPASDIELNEANLLSEEGTSFGFPVEIHLVNKFLGPYCYVGSYRDPIDVPFTTGETHPEPPNASIHGRLGEINIVGEGEILKVGTPERPTRLVNNEYAAPGVEGCGLDGRADAAVNGGLGLPSAAGNNSTELKGVLFQAGSERVAEHIDQ
jgi:hypothetical protein